MPTTTTAAVVAEAGGEFQLQNAELDDLREHEVLVRVTAVGLCHTDLSARAGHFGLAFPLVLGHEAAGVVSAVGANVTRVAPGDQVALTFTSCGTCRHCRGGHPAYCLTWVPDNLFNGGRRADGSATITVGGEPITGRFFGQSSLGKEAVVDERALVKVAADLPAHLLAPLGCGVQTGAGTVMNILRPEPGAGIAVFGSGAVGLSAVMAAALSPAASIIAVDVVRSRLDLALELGATAVVDASQEDVTARLAELTGGRGLDNAVDTTANPSVTRTAVDSLATFGTLAVVGAPPPGTDVGIDLQDLLVGRRIVGVTEGDSEPESFIPTLAELVRAGRLPLERIVQTFSFEEVNAAAAAAEDGSVIKPVLLMD